MARPLAALPLVLYWIGISANGSSVGSSPGPIQHFHLLALMARPLAAPGIVYN